MLHRLTDRIRALLGNSPLFGNSHSARTQRWWTRGLTIRIAGLVICCVPFAARAQAATITVVNTDDSGSGSLRSAVSQANSNPGADVIVFDGSVFTDANPDVIVLTSGRLAINADVMIQGPGASLLTIDGGGVSQLFYITGAATDATLDGLTLAGGRAAGTNAATQSGGAIYNNNSRLILTNSVLTGNSAVIYGGGVYNQSGTVTVSGVTATGNTADQGGGGLASNGLLNVASSTFQENSSAFGGAIAVGQTGTLDLADSLFFDNSAGVSGAGVLNFMGSATIQNSHFEENTSVRGGTVTSSGVLLLADSTFVGNSATYGGGAANYDGGTMTVLRGTFLENTATRDGGGLFNSTGGDTLVLDSTFTGNLGVLVGGAMANVRTGSIRVQGCTMSANTSNLGGGIANIYGAEMIVSNSTISDNLADDSGGGVLNDGLMTFFNSTIALNEADRPMGGGGGILTNTDADVVTLLFNTIVAGNFRSEVAANAPNDLGGKPVSEVSANNLIGAPDVTGGIVHGVNGNIVGASGPNGTRVPLPVSQVISTTLADNGGPTPTHALVTGSVAIDAGNSGLALDVDGTLLTTDQRGPGFARIVGAAVDIGAYEN